MSLALNARQWWECSGDELWAINLRRPNFVAQDDKCHRRGGNQALTNPEKSIIIRNVDQLSIVNLITQHFILNFAKTSVFQTETTVYIKLYRSKKTTKSSK